MSRLATLRAELNARHALLAQAPGPGAPRLSPTKYKAISQALASLDVHSCVVLPADVEIEVIQPPPQPDTGVS